MKQSLRLGGIAGITIELQWSTLVIIALIALTLATGVLSAAEPGRSVVVYWAVAVPAAAVFLACLLAHELAHSLVALRSPAFCGVACCCTPPPPVRSHSARDTR